MISAKVVNLSFKSATNHLSSPFFSMIMIRSVIVELLNGMMRHFMQKNINFLIMWKTLFNLYECRCRNIKLSIIMFLVLWVMIETLCSFVL